MYSESESNRGFSFQFSSCATFDHPVCCFTVRRIQIRSHSQPGSRIDRLILLSVPGGIPLARRLGEGMGNYERPRMEFYDTVVITGPLTTFFCIITAVVRLLRELRKTSPWNIRFRQSGNWEAEIILQWIHFRLWQIETLDGWFPINSFFLHCTRNWIAKRNYPT